jgi:hypothetical protein
MASDATTLFCSSTLCNIAIGRPRGDGGAPAQPQRVSELQILATGGDRREMVQRVTMPLEPVLRVLQKSTDVAGAVAGLDALAYLVAIGDVEDELEEEDLVPLVLRVLQANPESAEVATAGHAVLSCTALRSADPQLTTDGADPGAVARFRDFVSQRKEQRKHAKKVLARFRNQAAGAAFSTWHETTQQMVGIKRLVASLLHRELAAALHQWIKCTVGERAARRSARLKEADALLAACEHHRAMKIAEEAVVMGLGVLALANGSEETSERAPIGTAAAEEAFELVGGGGVDSEAVSAAAMDLRDRAEAALEAAEEAEKAKRIEGMLQRWKQSSLLLGWEGWLEFRRRVELCRRVAKKIALRGMHMAFDAWFDGVQHELAVKELMVRVANTMANLQVSRALNRWKEFVIELEEEREQERRKYEIEQERKRKEFLLRQLFKNL